ncbi:MAG: helix-turn-helix domain-containing protein [Pseudomonadota bacterium]
MASDTRQRILDAAERRVRRSGYNGFSFRDIAADVGVKSASVHHHFPTKEALTAVLASRYAARFEERLRREAALLGPLPALRQLFRASIEEDGQMCLCGMLAAESAALPESVKLETRRFFERIVAFLTDVECGPAMGRGGALEVVALLEGALLVGRASDDIAVFDAATERLTHWA